MDQELDLNMQDVINDIAEQLKNSTIMLSVMKSALKAEQQKVAQLAEANSVLEQLVSGLSNTPSPENQIDHLTGQAPVAQPSKSRKSSKD